MTTGQPWTATAQGLRFQVLTGLAALALPEGGVAEVAEVAEVGDVLVGLVGETDSAHMGADKLQVSISCQLTMT